MDGGRTRLSTCKWYQNGIEYHHGLRTFTTTFFPSTSRSEPTTPLSLLDCDSGLREGGAISFKIRYCNCCVYLDTEECVEKARVASTVRRKTRHARIHDCRRYLSDGFALGQRTVPRCTYLCTIVCGLQSAISALWFAVGVRLPKPEHFRCCLPG